MQHSNGGAELEQVWGSWTILMTLLYDNPKVAKLMDSRAGLYLSSHPFFSLTALLFAGMAALPVGLFLAFALVTALMSAVGFVFFEVFLLCVAGLTLLSVLAGLAVFSVLVSSIFTALYVSVSSVVHYYYPHLTTGFGVRRKENACEKSRRKEEQ